MRDCSGSVSVGATRQKAARWFLTREGMSRLSILSPHWHEESALGRLLERLPMVEWFYQAEADLPGMGELESFSWFNHVAWDAAARYRDGWAAFFWSGVMQRESRVKETFTKLGEDLAHHSVLGPDPYPGFLCFVVGDPWQREVVFRLAREFGCSDGPAGVVRIRRDRCGGQRARAQQGLGAAAAAR